jgi:hypothetical protein
MQYDKSLLLTDVAVPLQLTVAEVDRAERSLAVNGLAVLRGFLPKADVAEMQRVADASTKSGYTYAQNSCNISTVLAEGTREFRHPFLISEPAARLVTNHSFLNLLEKGLGDRAIIHHGLFQRSLTGVRQMLDWHIDCGSYKALNGIKKFADHRIRMIVYLSDVKDGGFSCILGSSEQALAAFLPLPLGDLFPVDAIPVDPDRRMTVNEPAGTVLLFNTHGLHRPEVPETERLVLNVWFARSDFKGRLPGALFSLALVPKNQRDKLYIFEDERGFDPLAAHPVGSFSKPSIIRRIARRLRV